MPLSLQLNIGGPLCKPLESPCAPLSSDTLLMNSGRLEPRALCSGSSTRGASRLCPGSPSRTAAWKLEAGTILGPRIRFSVSHRHSHLLSDVSSLVNHCFLYVIQSGRVALGGMYEFGLRWQKSFPRLSNESLLFYEHFLTFWPIDGFLPQRMISWPWSQPFPHGPWSLPWRMACRLGFGAQCAPCCWDDPAIRSSPWKKAWKLYVYAFAGVFVSMSTR